MSEIEVRKENVERTNNDEEQKEEEAPQQQTVVEEEGLTIKSEEISKNFSLSIMMNTVPCHYH